MNRSTLLTALAAMALAAGFLSLGCEQRVARPEKAKKPKATTPAAPTRPATATAPAPTKYDFTLTDQAGGKVSLSGFAGKIVVLEWVNPECPFVRRHYTAGTMVKLARRYKPRGVTWLAVNSTHTWGRAKNEAFHTEKQLPYPVLDDSSGKVGKLFGAKTTPHMFILDKDGKLAYAGGIDDDPRGTKAEQPANHVAKALDELLAGKPVSTPRARPYGCSVKYPPKPARPAAPGP